MELFKGLPFVQRDKGFSLIFAVSIMMVLSVMAVTFARMSIYEGAATQNYGCYVEAKLAAFAGIDHAIALSYSQLRTNGYVNWSSNDWYYLADDENKDGNDDGTPISFGYGRYRTDGNTYKVKAARKGQFNVNSHYAIDGGKFQAASNTIFRNILASLATRCNVTAAKIQDVVKAIRPDSPSEAYKSYSNMSEVENEVKKVIAVDTNVRNFLNNLCTDSWINKKTYAYYKKDAAFYKEWRAPVDVNVCSEQLLAALIENIKSTAIFYDSNTVSSDPQTSDGIQERELTLDFTSHASNIATSIIGGRNYTGWNVGSQCLETAIDGLDVDAVTQSTNDTKDWLRAEYRKKATRDTLKSTFNPNIVDNYWNPSRPGYRHVCKTQLYNASQLPAHTTELCFDEAETVELVSTGEIKADTTQIVGSCVLKLRMGLGTILTHSGQKELAANASGNILTFPAIRGETANDYDAYTGWVEIKPKVNIAGNYHFDSQSKNGTKLVLREELDGLYENIAEPGTYQNIGKIIPEVKGRLMRHSAADKPFRDSTINNLMPDGLASRICYGAPYYYYFLKPAIQDYSTTAPDLTVDINNKNVGNIKGTIAFWIKIADKIGGEQKDGSTDRLKGVSCGLFKICIRSKQKATKSDNQPFYEGAELIGYINKVGELCISRMYWAMYWDDGLDTLSTNSGKSGAWVGSKSVSDGDGTNRKYGRVDVVEKVGADGKDWKPNEWHHIKIIWEDDNTGSPLQVYLDQTGSALDVKKHQSSLYTPGEFCCVNEVDPQDSMFINGFIRWQNESYKGVDSFFPNTKGKTFYPGNVTMDSFISSPSTNVAISSGRYTADENYNNYFEISEPGRYILGTLHASGYNAGGGTLSNATFATGLSAGQYFEVTGSASVQKGYKVNINYNGNTSSVLESANLRVYYAYPQIFELVYVQQ